MAAFVVRRLLWSALLLLIITFITYVVFVLLPSADPALLRAGRNPTPELVASIRETLGLDRPWYVQYAIYVKNLVLHFDFGYSYQNNVAVKDTLFDRLPATVSLAVGGAVIWLLIGVAVGIASAVKRGTLIDRLTMGGALIAISAPAYWLGLVAIYLFSKDLGKVLPIFAGAGQYTPITQDPLAWASALVLPWIVLATSFSAVYARFLRSNLLDVLGEDYIRTAKAKGLRWRRVVGVHTLRNSLIPVVTAAGPLLGYLITGSFVIEQIFAIPGIGRYYVTAVTARDYSVVMGLTVLLSLIVIMANLVVDVLYGFLDPRTREART
jgi:peptide/nickel transport system permease protein